jgi:hypothetical protein
MDNRKVVKRLRLNSKPFPRFIEEVISLYDVKVPFFFVSQGLLFQFTDDDAVGTVWRDPPRIGKPQGVLISYEVLPKVKEKNKSLILLKEVLHEIGHLKLLKETDKLKTKIFSELGSSESTFMFCRMAIEGKVDSWMKTELRKIRPFINVKRNGWKDNISLEYVKKYI